MSDGQPTWKAGDVHVPTVLPVDDNAVTVTFHTPLRAWATLVRRTVWAAVALNVRVTVPPLTRVSATV